LYCGSKLPDKKNWVTYCQKKVDSILKKANDKLPKKLLPKFDIEIETTEMGPGYYDKSNPAKWEYSHSRTGFNLKKFDRIKRSPKKFYKKDFATPQSSLCKKCADDFIARVTKIFSSVSGTRFAKKHAKIYDKITTEYLQVFEELIDNAP
ncbi:MAG: hypothetical protein U9O98_00045, partial [Asgard group archaeon]|nr:hypothetical protein [Asgard group archaeon]